MPYERDYLFPQLWASQSAISHHDYPHSFGNCDRQQTERLCGGVYPLAGLVAGHDDPRDRGWRIPDKPRSRPRRKACRKASSGLWRARGPFDSHSDKTRLISGAKAGADVCLIRRRRGAVGSVAEPLAAALSGGGESSHAGEIGGDCSSASALGGYRSERPK